MTEKEENAIRTRILARPEPVRVLLKIIATKLSINDPDERNEKLAMWMQRALEKWDADYRRDFAALMPEAEAARLVIEELRNGPRHAEGWGKILRQGTN